MSAQILQIIDDIQLAHIIKKNLKQEGYQVITKTDGSSGLNAAYNSKYQLVIIDYTLYKLDGLTVCKQLRQDDIPTPIIMLTDRLADETLIKILKSGADTYFEKPINTSLLRAIVNTLLTRTPQPKLNILKLGELEIHLQQRQVRIKNTPLDMRRREFEILRLFAENQGKVLSRDHLNKRTSNDFDIPTENTIDVHISNIRRKILAGGGDPGFIQTIYGIGYRIDVKERNNVLLQ